MICLLRETTAFDQMAGFSSLDVLKLRSKLSASQVWLQCKPHGLDSLYNVKWRDNFMVYTDLSRAESRNWLPMEGCDPLRKEASVPVLAGSKDLSDLKATLVDHCPSVNLLYKPLDIIQLCQILNWPVNLTTCMSRHLPSSCIQWPSTSHMIILCQAMRHYCWFQEAKESTT